MKSFKIEAVRIILLLAIGAAFPVAAQEAGKTAAGAPKTATKHSLWKIEGKKASVYLLGSIHVLKSSDYPLAPQIETAFSNSDIVAFETDIAALEDPATAMKMMGKMQLPEGETLETQLAPDVYKLFKKHADDSGMPAMLLEKMKPAMAAMMIEVLELTKLGLEPDKGVDKHFFGIAREASKQIIPLETVEFQMNLLTDFTKEEGQAMMKATLKDVENIKSDLADLLAAWKTGESGKLDKMLNEAMQDSPAIYKRLVTQRNHNWIPKVEELAKGDKNAIVIVGAAHLVGKEGVVELIKDKGYKVVQE